MEHYNIVNKESYITLELQNYAVSDTLRSKLNYNFPCGLSNKEQ